MNNSDIPRRGVVAPGYVDSVWHFSFTSTQTVNPGDAFGFLQMSAYFHAGDSTNFTVTRGDWGNFLFGDIGYYNPPNTGADCEED